MALVTHKFKLDLTPGASRQVLYTSQGDIGRPFEADLYWNGSPWTATGTTANIRGRKPDETVFDYTATVDGSTVTFETTEQMTIISGPVECELVFSNDGDVIASANFVLMVEESPYDPDALSESVIPGIVDLIEDTIGGDVRDEVQAELEAHPEWTTTVQDGAITEAKINAELLPKIENAYVTPEQFGAVGDGTTDDTASIQAAINSGKKVWFTSAYKVSQSLSVGVPTILFGGKLIASESIVLLDVSSDNVCIYNMELDGDGVGVGGVYCYSANNIFIEKVNAHDFISSSTKSAQGISLKTCTHSAVKDCKVYNISADTTNTNMCQAIELSFCKNVKVAFCSIDDVTCTATGTHEADGIHIANDGKKDTTSANEYDIFISDCVFGTCTKRALKIQQSGVIVENCLIKEDATNTQSWIACYYEDIKIKGCTILGYSPIPVCIGVTNVVYPTGSTLKDIVIEDCYIVNRSLSHQGCVTMIGNKMENIIIRNNRLFSNSTVKAYGILAQTEIENIMIANNTFEKLTSDTVFTSFIFVQSTSKNTQGKEIVITGNIAKTNDTFLEIADSLAYQSIIVSNNILDNENVADMLSYRRYFVLYKNTTYIPTIKTSANIFPSGIIETYPV